jgi:hypothetical protein
MEGVLKKKYLPGWCDKEKLKKVGVKGKEIFNSPVPASVSEANKNTEFPFDLCGFHCLFIFKATDLIISEIGEMLVSYSTFQWVRLFTKIREYLNDIQFETNASKSDFFTRKWILYSVIMQVLEESTIHGHVKFIIENEKD